MEGSVTELVAAWDRIWMRLPARAWVGSNAEIILAALKLLLAASPAERIHQEPEGETGAARAVDRGLGVALLLADLCAGGMPLDAEVVAAGALAEAFCNGWVTHEEVSHRLGSDAAQLLHDVARVHNAPHRVDLSDDQAARSPSPLANRPFCRLFGHLLIVLLSDCQSTRSRSFHLSAAACPVCHLLMFPCFSPMMAAPDTFAHLRAYVRLGPPSRDPHLPIGVSHA